MAAGGFLGGALGGYADTASKRKKAGQQSLLSRFRNRKKKKAEPSADPMEYKRGGRVRRTGMAKVHAGEYVIPAKRTKKRASKKR